MQRITRLCLAAFVATAMVVLPSTASAAPGFKSESKSTLLTGANTSSQVFTFASGLTCNDMTVAGSMKLFGEQSVQVTPTFSGCYSGGVKPFAMNGCSLTLRPGAETSKGKFKGTFDIGPAGCGPITTVVQPSCNTSIGAQNGLSATFENIGSGSSSKVIVTVNAWLKYSQSGLICGSGTYNNGYWNGSFEVKGTVGGVSTGLRVATDVPVGFDLTPGQPQIEAERYPATLTGSQSATDELTFTGDVGKARCNSALVNGLFTAPSARMGISTVNTGCTAFGLQSVPVVMNGCQYLIDVVAAGTPYEGTLTVSCPAGQKIEIKAPGCLVSIPGQIFQAYEGVELKSVGSGIESSIQVDLDIAGLEYTETRPLFGFCPNNGTRNNGTLSGTLTVGAI